MTSCTGHVHLQQRSFSAIAVHVRHSGLIVTFTGTSAPLQRTNSDQENKENNKAATGRKVSGGEAPLR